MNRLRFPDEFVRHKVLDLVGDLALLGMPILGHVVATRAGHAVHSHLIDALRPAGCDRGGRPQRAWRAGLQPAMAVASTSSKTPHLPPLFLRRAASLLRSPFLCYYGVSFQHHQEGSMTLKM